MPKELSESETEEFIMDLLRNNEHLTTRGIEEEASKRDLSCPDAIIRFLNKMKLKGLIKGKLSIEHRGWIWFMENKG